MHTILNLIDGRMVHAASCKLIPVVEPATGHPYAQASASDAADIESAAKAATRAFARWSVTPAAERSRCLLRLSELVDANIERLAEAESRDSGKPISLARAVDIPRAAANLRFFATGILHTAGEFHDFDGGGVPSGMPALNFTLRRPRGVAGCISPWNLPLYLFTWKIAPALAAGCTVIGKPSEVTPMTASLLGELAIEAGLPPGVLNIVHGTGPDAGAALVHHPEVTTITFTGSTHVGRWIGKTAGDMLKRVSLELGGKNPFIVFDDADFDGPHGAIETAARAAFSNQGQICLCGSRLLIHESVYDRVREGIVRHARSLRIGDPADPATQFGALVSEAHLAKVEGCVREAARSGGTILCGGERIAPVHLPDRCRGGYFFAPTVIEGLNPTCSVEQEEIFGPVVSLQRFQDEQEAVHLANSTPYGLAATIFTRDGSRAHRVAASIDAGIVWVNCWMVRDLRTPFGGMKQSGIGREGGVEALKFFTEAKNVCVRI
ncbi:MAG: aldehyde dehydrogenase [Phycisphaeraceae bacterium]|nr:aldehyde dehydrogenase [Phycisphaeraceae bacterium]